MSQTQSVPEDVHTVWVTAPTVSPGAPPEPQDAQPPSFFPETPGWRMIDFTFTDPAPLGIQTQRFFEVIHIGDLVHGGPAHAQGIMIGDEIITVNDVSVLDLPRGQAHRTLLRDRPLELRVRRKAIPEAG